MPALDEYALSDLRVVAAQLGVKLGAQCKHDEAVALLKPVADARKARDELSATVVTAVLALLVVLRRALAAKDPAGYFAALNVRLDATEDEIKAAHRVRSMLLHEDRHAASPPAEQHLAKELQQKVNQAKDILLDHRNRAAYVRQGTPGIARADMVAPNIGMKEFLTALDFIEKKDKLADIEREVAAEGQVSVRFDGRPFFDTAVTSLVHDALDRVGYNWRWTPSEEEADGDSEVNDGEANEDDEVDVDLEEDEDEEDEEDEESETGLSPKTQLAQVEINGRQRLVVLLDEKVEAELEKRLRQQAARKAAEAEEREEAPPPSSGFNLSSWPQYIPQATQMYTSHTFTYPLASRHHLRFTSGGPPLMLKVLWTWAASTLQQLTADVKWRVNKLSTSYSWLRRFSEELQGTLKYKLSCSRGSSSFVSSLVTKFTKSVPGANLGVKFEMPSGDYSKLTWFRTVYSEKSTTALMLSLGRVSIDNNVSNVLHLPRSNVTLADGNDEDETEAARNFGQLTTFYAQSWYPGVTRIGWDAMFYLSKKTTVNQVGFGVTTYVPYSFIGVGWSTNEQYMSRTELKLTFQRYKFRLDVPIMIASATDGPTVGTYLVAPFLLFKVAQELLIKPLRNINRRREFMKRRIAMREKLWEQRSQALAVQQLLKTEAKRRLDEELGTDGGLVIQNAKYGVLRPQFAEPDDDEKLPPRTLDVTVPLQALVQQHHLILNAGEKHHFDGFYDVDPEGDEEKYLRVRYMFLNMPHEVEILEHMELALPLKEHRIEPKSPPPTDPKTPRPRRSGVEGID